MNGEISEPPRGTGEQTPKIDRRQLLEQISRQIGRVGFIGLTLETAALPYLWEVMELGYGSRLLDKHKERYLARSPEGYQIGIISGVHGVYLFQPLTPIREEDLFTPTGALFLEDVGNDYLNPEIQSGIPQLVIQVSQKKKDFYGEPLKYALEHRIPIVFGDLTLRGFEDFKDASTLSTLAPFIPALAAGVATSTEFTYSRRDFLRSLIKYGGLAGTVFLSRRTLLDIARVLGLRPDSEVGRDFQAVFSDLTIPGDIPIVMRNIVWALKSIDLYRMGLVPKERIINILGGAEHKFLDFFVRHPELATKYWEIFGYKEEATKFAGGDPSWVYKSYIFTPPDQGKVVTHDNLRALVT